MKRLLLAGLVAASLLLTACSGDSPFDAPDLKSRVDVDNPALRHVKQRIGVQPCPALSGKSSDLADVTLPCLGGGRSVTLSDIKGPAVVSLWASWCTSCPHELPLYQRLSRKAGDRLTVLGVDWQDTQPGAALTLLGKTRATFWQLADPGGVLADHYRLTALPGVLLVDRSGHVTFMLRRIDTYADLTALVREHTGVNVAAG
jgi:thiol-disulfide isomerase/thioredoxin